MRTAALMLAALPALLRAAPPPPDEPYDYRLGDTVRADIVASEPLLVVDAAATEALKQKEALKVPAIFFYHPEAADEVEQDFRARFSAVRSNFFDAMGAVYQRKRLNPQWLNSPRFKTLSATFRRQYPVFPQLNELMAAWATGRTNEAGAIENELAGRLRAAMGQPIRSDTLPANIKLGAQVRVFTPTNFAETLSFELAEQHAVTLPRTNLLTVTRARAALQQLAPAHERPQTKFLASFLKPNCTLSEALTLQSRRHRVDPLYIADRYEAGQIIARRGQTVDAKILAALQQGKSAYRLPPGPPETAAGQAAWLDRLPPWWGAGLALVGAGLILGVWRWRANRKPDSILPARVAGDGRAAGIVSCPSCDENIVIPTQAVENLSAGASTWRQRALTAEQQAQQARAALRAGVLPHLADWLKQRFVRRLVTERRRMLEAQKSAASELAELEQRLDDLHAPLQERLRAYEKRIAELEKSLAAKGEENRALLRVRIQLTREQLERERARKPAELN
jgi:hypothetical protein